MISNPNNLVLEIRQMIDGIKAFHLDGLQRAAELNKRFNELLSNHDPSKGQSEINKEELITISSPCDNCEKVRTCKKPCELLEKELPKINAGAKNSSCKYDANYLKAIDRTRTKDIFVLYKNSVHLFTKREWQVVTLRIQEGQTFKTIGTVLGIKTSTASDTFQRAERKLKQHYQKKRNT